MSTRSRIALKLEDGQYRSVYCHWDGYPEGVGLVLSRHYHSEPKAHMVVRKGDLSSLEPQAPDAYKDRGEPWERVKPVISPTRAHLLATARNDGADFLYTFANDQWHTTALKEDAYD